MSEETFNSRPPQLAHAHHDQPLPLAGGIARYAVAFGQRAVEHVEGALHGLFRNAGHDLGHFVERGNAGQVAQGNPGVGPLLEVAQHRLQGVFVDGLVRQPVGHAGGVRHLVPDGFNI
jgi:hypothetical protein